MAVAWPCWWCYCPWQGLFVWVVTRAGPLAPVPVVVATVEERALTPALFGIGTVEARYTYLVADERVVAYSQRALAAHHRIEPVERLPGVRS